MKYCSNCSGEMHLRTPDDDDRPRYVCDNCNTIHYENPKMVVGAIPVIDEKVLLCRRAIEPCHGKWTLPAGYLENGETVEQGARRETREEACAVLDDMEPYSLLNLAFINQVYFLYRARLVGQEYGAGSESLEVRLFAAPEIPWDELAFAVIRRVLTLYCQDLPNNHFPFRVVDIGSHNAWK
ncbi:MAG: NUDIX hydrolase [Desulfopila sp.]